MAAIPDFNLLLDLSSHVLSALHWQRWSCGGPKIRVFSQAPNYFMSRSSMYAGVAMRILGLKRHMSWTILLPGMYGINVLGFGHCNDAINIQVARNRSHFWGPNFVALISFETMWLESICRAVYCQLHRLWVTSFLLLTFWVIQTGLKCVHLVVWWDSLQHLAGTKWYIPCLEFVESHPLVTQLGLDLER